MTRLGKFEHFRFVGDKRTQRMYDLDDAVPAEVLDELVASEAFTCFAPDSEAEGRNRGYRLVRFEPSEA